MTCSNWDLTWRVPAGFAAGNRSVHPGRPRAWALNRDALGRPQQYGNGIADHLQFWIHYASTARTQPDIQGLAVTLAGGIPDLDIEPEKSSVIAT